LPNPTGNRSVPILKIGISLLLVFGLILRVDFRSLVNNLRELSGLNWCINFFIFLFAHAIATAKWKLLIPEQRFSKLIRLNFIAQYYAVLLPGQIAGEAVKAYRLGRGQKNAEQIAASVAIDRFTGFLGLLAVAIAGAGLNATALRPRLLFAFLLATIALLVLLFCSGLPYWKHLFRFLSNRGDRGKRLAGQLERLLVAWRIYARAPALMLASVGLGVIFQLLAVIIAYRIGEELGLLVILSDWCWIFGVVSLITALPFTIGGLGLREGSFVGALALLGISSAKSLAVSFSIFSLMLAGALVGAILDWSHLTARKTDRGAIG
jgi:uncharacterized protein (TIRG00374 family)